VVQINEQAMEVVGSQSTFQRELAIDSGTGEAPYTESKITAESLREVLDLDMGEHVKVTHAAKNYIYRFDPDVRIQDSGRSPDDEAVEGFPLLPVDPTISSGGDYIVAAVEFSIESPGGGDSTWLALIEIRTGSVLHLRSLIGCAMGVIVDGHTLGDDAEGVTDADNATSQKPNVVFFDIGDTLGRPNVGPGNSLDGIDLFPDVPEILKELHEKSIRLGILSNPGPFPPSLITSLLGQAGILQFLDEDLIVFGGKDSKEIFEDAAATADVNTSQCLFVGEKASERFFAIDAGFSAVSTPFDAIGVVDPDAVVGWVYLVDPATKAGSTAVRPNGTRAELDAMRDLVTLRGLKAPDPGETQELNGEFVEIKNIDGPNPPIPTTDDGDFRFSVDTDEFGAVCAYHNCDRLFRLLQDFGFSTQTLTQYFGNTQFPVPVDHRFHYEDRFGVFQSNTINASAPGSRLGRRSHGFRYALAERNTSVCMSADWRVTLHEFGHAVMWGRVGSPNFKFAHSAGDALGAILNDPGNQAARERTFPWSVIRREHMQPATGLAWYGTRYRPFDWNRNRNANPQRPLDAAGYVAEEMLSSTMFRIYRSAGGDSSDIARQRFAANYVAFLIFKAVGLMSPQNNPEHPEGFADLLMQADNGTFLHHGTPAQIGMLRKVIRWGFEMQGAYRNRPTPTNIGLRQPGTTDQIGNPPSVDVFVNDGRDGQYEFLSDPLHSLDIWNRHAADDGSVHQPPILGAANHLYVRVSNRGTRSAANVTVEAFRSRRPEGHNWPDDWSLLHPAPMQLNAPIPSGSSTVAGPIEWTPTSTQPTVMIAASATGDAHLLGRFGTSNSIPNHRIVPLDNNVAQRTMTTISARPEALV